MSLLADLLSKIKHKEQQGVIPPNLAQVVQRASDKRKIETKVKVALFVALLLVATGFGTVYFVNIYLKPALPVLAVQNVRESVGTETNQPAASKLSAPIATTPIPQSPAPAKPVFQPNAPALSSPASATSPHQQQGIKVGSGRPPIIPPSIKGTESLPKEITSDVSFKVINKSTVKKTSDLSETAKNEKDVALYTARANEQQKDYGQAITNYKKALEKDPGNYLIMNSLANLLIKTGSYKESVKYSMDALSINKNHVPSLINLSIANIQLGNMTEGELYLLRAKSIEPSNKTVLFNLGLLYERLTNFQEALNAFQKLGDMKAIEGFVGMARIFEKQGKKPEAEQIYRDILWMDNIDPAIKQLASERIQVIDNR